MGIMNHIRRIFGKVEFVIPISEPNIYRENRTSFAGNSLEGSNLLLITNYSKNDEVIKKAMLMFRSEGCNAKYYKLDAESFEIQSIVDAGRNNIRPFDHIINFIDVEDGTTISDDWVEQIYSMLQKETDYLVIKTKQSSLCSIFFVGEDETAKKKGEINAFQSLIKGLGPALARHGIIENGAAILKSIPARDATAVAIFLSSKYGQILAGEVLDMSVSPKAESSVCYE